MRKPEDRTPLEQFICGLWLAGSAYPSGRTFNQYHEGEIYVGRYAAGIVDEVDTFGWHIRLDDGTEVYQ